MMTEVKLKNNSSSNTMIQDLRSGDWFTFPDSDKVYIYINNDVVQSLRLNDNFICSFERDERCIRLSMVNISYMEEH